MSHSRSMMRLLWLNLTQTNKKLLQLTIGHIQVYSLLEAKCYKLSSKLRLTDFASCVPTHIVSKLTINLFYYLIILHRASTDALI